MVLSPPELALSGSRGTGPRILNAPIDQTALVEPSNQHWLGSTGYGGRHGNPEIILRWNKHQTAQGPLEIPRKIAC
jgi:hypothetical protein